MAWTHNYLLLVVFVEVFNNGLCRTFSEAPQYFGTKTTYNVSRKHVEELQNNQDNTNILYQQDTFDNCEAVHINALIRHGTRNPGKKDVGKFTEFILRVRDFVNDNGKSSTRIAQVLYDIMETWFDNAMFPNATISDKELVKNGYEELFKLGENMLNRFSHLLDDPKYMQFISSDTHRTIHSCEAFQDGLKLNSADKVKTLNNRLLRFYDFCPLYTKTMEDGENSLREQELFKVGPEVEKIIQKIQNYLAVRKSHRAKPIDISYQDLKALYTIAACEIAIYNTSQLASIFDQEDLLVMEYAADLRSYWKRSYGNPINYAQACQLFTNIFTTLQREVNTKSRFYKGIFRFGHAETLLPIMSLLGIYKDESSLRALTFNKQHKRLFKTSKIMPFGANFVLVLYKCNTNKGVSNYSNYKVGMLHNEAPVYLPSCPDELLCPFDKFYSYYVNIVDECNLTDICKIRDHSEL